MQLVKNGFLKNAGTLFTGTVVSQAVGFLILPILSRVYSVSDFGDFTLFASLIAVGIVFSGLRMELGVVAEDNEEDAKALLQLSIIANCLIAIVITVLLSIFLDSITELFNLPKNTSWLIWVPMLIALTGICESIVAWYNRMKRYTKISSSKVINSTSTNGIKLIVPLFKGFKVNGLISGQIIGQVITFFALIWKLGIKGLFTIDVHHLKSVFIRHKELAIFSSPAALVNVLALYMPVFLIAHFDGNAATGLFGNARTLVFVPLSYISLSIGQVFFERIARLRSEQNEASKLSHELINFLFILALVPVVVIAIWGKQIIPFILGPQWQDAGIYAQILVLFFFTLYLTNPFAGAFIVYKKLKNQLVYNLSFLMLTAGAMYYTYSIGYDTKTALAVFASVGIAMRLIILNYFFHLFGRALVVKTLIGCSIIAVVLVIAYHFTGTFPL